MTGAGAFWAMGGYAGYVWPAYGITILALVLLLVSALRAQRRADRQLAALEGTRVRRRAPTGPDKPAGKIATGDLA
jgi:heme exporter protein D